MNAEKKIVISFSANAFSGSSSRDIESRGKMIINIACDAREKQAVEEN